MNICLVTEATGAGVGTHVIQLAAGLLSRGHRVDLAYSPVRMDATFRLGVDGLSKSKDFSSLSMAIHRDPHLSDIGIMKKIRARSALRGGYDIVHCHSTKAGLVGRLGMLLTKARLVYTPHAMLTMNPQLSRTKRWFVGRMEQILGHLGHGLIAVSDEERSHAIGLGIPASRLFVVPNGIDLQEVQGNPYMRDSVRAEHGLKESDLCLGFVGRLFPQKAPENLLRAFALLDARITGSTYLLMVGTGPLLPSLKALARTLHIEDRVKWLGERHGRTVMCAFDLFILPSDYEGLPYVVLEAMSHGLPVVSTAVGGVGMLVRDDHNGYVIPVQRPDRLAAAITSICRNKIKRKQMGEESARRVQGFTSEEMIAKTIEVYKSVSKPDLTVPPRDIESKTAVNVPTPATVRS